MTLFTKPECNKCEHLKNSFDLTSFGIEEQRLTPENSDALAELAYYECVDLAERELPILVTRESRVLSGLVPIRKYLRSLN